MTRLKAWIGRLARRHRARLPYRIQRRYCKVVALAPRGAPRGSALLSYALTAAGAKPDDPVFRFHSGPWESSVIADWLTARGYAVDVIHYTNRRFVPERPYDIIVTLTPDLYRLAACAPRPADEVLKIWHMNLRSLEHTNRTELDRIADLERRRPGALYAPKRQEPDERVADKALALADACVLVGNGGVLSTYPARFHGKITLIPISASPTAVVKRAGEYAPPEREFVWYFGSGAVRKGLDLLLEIFPQHPEWTLHVIGLARAEPDFVKIYRRELLETNNIRYHGHLDPMSDAFAAVMRRSFCFIAPTCTESISTAVATMMQVGLYPLVSRETGVDLPAGAGRWLEPCDIQTIERALAEARALPDNELERQAALTQAYALEHYSRERFRAGMEAFLERAVGAWEARLARTAERLP
jgi:glycosyltransferase involved in cell wall biosynthesis